MSRIAWAMFTAGATAISAMLLAIDVSAGEMQVLSASQEVKIAGPGAGSLFVSALPGSFLTEGSRVRTDKGGWAVLRLGNETQVELRADSEVVFLSTRRFDETQTNGPATGETGRPGNARVFSTGDASKTAETRSDLAATPAGTISTVIEVELRRGGLGVLADGGTELRVRFAGGVAVAHHARFAVTAKRDDQARVIVERGVARVATNGSKEQAVPTAGQFVVVNNLATGHTVTAVQPVRSNDAEAVVEMAALHFVPATVDPAAKAPPTAVDPSTANRPIITAPAPSNVVVADGPSTNWPATTAVPTLPPTLATDNQPSTASASISPFVPPVDHGVALSGGLGVDPLRAPANGANIEGPVTSPEHP